MAKFTFLLLTIVAIQAVFGINDVRRHSNEIETIKHRLVLNLQDQSPMTIRYHCHQLAQTVYDLANVLRVEANRLENCREIRQVISELERIHLHLLQVDSHGNTVYCRDTLETALETILQQLAELVNCIRNETDEHIVQKVYRKFGMALEDIMSNKISKSTQKVQEVVAKIHSTTADLKECLQSNTCETEDSKESIERFSQNIEDILQKLANKTETVSVTTLEQLSQKLRRCISILNQVSNVKINQLLLRSELASQLQSVAREIDELTQISRHHLLVNEVVVDYSNALAILRRSLLADNKELTLGRTNWRSHEYQRENYNQDNKATRLTSKIEETSKDLIDTIKNVNLDNAVVKSVALKTIRNYLQQIVSITSEVDSNLRLGRIIASLDRVLNTGVTKANSELKHQITSHIERITEEIKKTVALVNGSEILINFLNISQNHQLHLQAISGTAGQVSSTTDLLNRIQIIVNGITVTLKISDIDNKSAMEILDCQTEEYSNWLDSVSQRLDKLDAQSPLSSKIINDVRENLKVIGRPLNKESVNANSVRMFLLAKVHDTALELHTLHDMKQHDENVSTTVRGICTDFLTILQNLQIQLHNALLRNIHKQTMQVLVLQIQTLTNNVEVSLRNIPAGEVIVRQKLERQLASSINNIQNICDAFGEADKTDSLKMVVLNLEKILTSLGSIEVAVNIQAATSEMNQLSWIAQNTMTHNLNNVVRTILEQYLITMQDVQIEIQRLNHTIQVGKTPAELTIQIQAEIKRLNEMYWRMNPRDWATERVILWQLQRLGQVVNNIVNHLDGDVRENGVINNLQRIQMSLQKISSQNNLHVHLTSCLKQIGNVIEEFAFQSDLQENHNVRVRSSRMALVELLVVLQSFHVQLQDHYQGVDNDQEIHTLLTDIRTTAHQLWSLIEPTRHSSRQLKLTLIMGVQEMSKTVKNIVDVIANNLEAQGSEHKIVEDICESLSKICILMQDLITSESEITVTELHRQLNRCVENTVSTLEKLGVMDKSLYQNHEVIKGIINHVLGALRNIQVQISNVQWLHQNYQDVKQTGLQIQTITNGLIRTLQQNTIDTTYRKHIIAIQIFKYTQTIQKVVKKLNTKDVSELQRTISEIHRIIVSLCQHGEFWITLNGTELRTHLVSQIENTNALMQSLLLNKVNDTDEDCIKKILVEYLVAIQNLDIQLQTELRPNNDNEHVQQLTLTVDSAITDLFSILHDARSNGDLVQKILIIESEQLAKTLKNIINRVEFVNSVAKRQSLDRVIVDLRDTQFSFQRIAVEGPVNSTPQLKLQLTEQIHKSAVCLNHILRDVILKNEESYVQNALTLLRPTEGVLSDYLVAIQNFNLQVLNTVNNFECQNSVATKSVPHNELIGMPNRKEHVVSQVEQVIEIIQNIIQQLQAQVRYHTTSTHTSVLINILTEVQVGLEEALSGRTVTTSASLQHVLRKNLAVALDVIDSFSHNNDEAVEEILSESKNRLQQCFTQEISEFDGIWLKNNFYTGSKQ